MVAILHIHIDVSLIKFTLDEIIQPLPDRLLPGPSCGMTTTKASVILKKRKREKNVNDSAKITSSGLEKTIKELMANYIPASAENLAFYCRICRFHGMSLEELEAHKKTEMHVLAVDYERKSSTCKLCKKEFTSPLQLKEHLKGKQHLSKLEYVRSIQSSNKRFV